MRLSGPSLSLAPASLACVLPVFFALGLLGAVLLVRAGLLLPPDLYLQTLGLAPVSLHTAMEMFTVLVAILIFSTGYHIPDERRPLASLILAAAFLAVGVLDFLHTLSYPGMADFLTPNTQDKAILLWLAARMLAAVVLLAYLLLPAAPVFGRLPHPLILVSSLVYALFFAYAAIWRAAWFPATFVDGQGLTSFKIGVEWLVITFNLVALAAIGLRPAIRERVGAGLLVPALLLSVASELCFTFYVDPFDNINISGHLLKALAYLLFYRVMFLTSVRMPILHLDLARRSVAQAKKEWEDTFDAISDLAFLHDAAYRIIRCNLAYQQTAGLPLVEIIGRPYYEVFPKGPGPESGCLQTVGESKARRREIFVAEQKRYYDVQYIMVAGDTGVFRHFLHILNDITERRQHEEELRQQATHDALTGLANRTLVQDRLQQAMPKAARSGTTVAAMILDLDNFKAINNSFGHAAGDELLVEVAARLCEVLRAEDTVGRLGGDEFAIVLPELKKADDAARMVDKILAVFSLPFTTGTGFEIFSGGSLGIAMFPQDGEDTETILRHADTAMYQAKQAGRGTYAFFTPRLDRQLHEDLHIHGRLKHALAEQSLALHYQPQVDIATGAVIGVEALVRWHDSVLGEVPPDRFIPIAEATGLILPLGDWVLTTACRQIAAWQAAGTPLKVAVNLSGQQFRQHDLVAKVGTILAETGASPGLLELEITETAAMENVKLAAQQLAGLIPLGLSVSLDDFGTGYSSLAYLKALPIAKLKIDRSFIAELGRDRDDEMIVQTVIGLARNLKLDLIAEGVETNEQLAFLRKHGCKAFQGWLFCRALPAGELEARLRQTAMVQ